MQFFVVGGDDERCDSEVFAAVDGVVAAVVVGDGCRRRADVGVVGVGNGVFCSGNCCAGVGYNYCGLFRRAIVNEGVGRESDLQVFVVRIDNERRDGEVFAAVDGVVAAGLVGYCCRCRADIGVVFVTYSVFGGGDCCAGVGYNYCGLFRRAVVNEGVGRKGDLQFFVVGKDYERSDGEVFTAVDGIVAAEVVGYCGGRRADVGVVSVSNGVFGGRDFCAGVGYNYCGLFRRAVVNEGVGCEGDLQFLVVGKDDERCDGEVLAAVDGVVAAGVVGDGCCCSADVGVVFVAYGVFCGWNFYAVVLDFYCRLFRRAVISEGVGRECDLQFWVVGCDVAYCDFKFVANVCHVVVSLDCITARCDCVCADVFAFGSSCLCAADCVSDNTCVVAVFKSRNFRSQCRV